MKVKTRTEKIAGMTSVSIASAHEIGRPIIARCGAILPPRNPRLRSASSGLLATPSLPVARGTEGHS